LEIRTKLGSFGEKAQLILSCIFYLYSAKTSCCVRFCNLIRQLAPPGLRGALRLLAGHWREGGRTAPNGAAMASGPNPDPHVWRGDWFAQLFRHVFEMS
jgi:hypothetical protein